MRNQTVLAWIIPVLLLAGCQGKAGNIKIKEAAAIHIGFMDKYDSLYHVLLDEKERINNNLKAEGTDSLQKSAYESMLRSIDKSLSLLDGWEEAVVGVPGLERPHHHHHGHDHHHHHNDDILKSMSDQEILDLQKAFASRLDEVMKEINTFLDVIKMYDAQKVN